MYVCMYVCVYLVQIIQIIQIMQIIRPRCAVLGGKSNSGRKKSKKITCVPFRPI